MANLVPKNGPVIVPENRTKIKYTLDTELRHVKPSKLSKLSSIIDHAEDRSKLLIALTKHEVNNSKTHKSSKLSLYVISLIEQQVDYGKSPTLVLLNHWATLGRRRPTIGNLIEYLKYCNLERAKEYIRQDILGIDPSPESLLLELPNPPLAISNNLTDILDIESGYFIEGLKEIVEKLSPDCPRYSFKSIYDSTNGFCHKPFDPSTMTGTKVGEGRFSSVFKAQTFLTTDDRPLEEKIKIVAAKLLRTECNIGCLSNEIDLALRVEHTNVLEFYGVAIGQQAGTNSPNYLCLIYKLMQNGSLFNCIGSGLITKSNRFLSWCERVPIAVKIARGIVYLHKFPDGPVIHRDIKTANIFIDDDLEPKIGDFTLIRQLQSNETQYSQSVQGTGVYMPPEAFRGDISTKFDTFSFGIVLLELLTGLKPFLGDKNEELLTLVTDKLSDIEDNVSDLDFASAKDEYLKEILDKRAGDWSVYCSKKLFDLALKATQTRKKDRPEMVDILLEMDPLIGQC